MNIQEWEERNFMPQSELQNALELSQSERKPDDKAKISAKVAEGRFCVVTSGPEYCPRTDALMGSRDVLEGDFATREEAQAFCDDLNEKYGCPEINSEVLPRLAPPVSPERELKEGDLPF